MARNNSVQVFKGGWKELENAVFTDNQTSLSISGTLFSFHIKPDGTELYVLQNNVSADDIIQTYPLAIPWDPNSRGALIRSFTFDDDANAVSLNFQDDGTKMFVVGQVGKVIFAFTLPTPFDTDSIIASPVSLSLSAVSGAVFGSAFSRDGDFLFVTELTGGFVYSFPLPTPWDIESNTSSTSKDTGMDDLTGLTVKPEGDKMYFIETTANNIIHELDMSTPNDISTLVDNGNELDFGSISIFDVVFRSNGGELFIIEDCDLFTRFHVDEDWNVTTASLFTNTLATVDYQSISWKPDGTKFFAVNSSAADRIDEYAVPDRWNQTGATLAGNFALAGIADIPRGIWVSPDGKTCMVIDIDTDSVVQLDMSTGWDRSTMSDPGISFDLGAAAGLAAPSGIVFTKDQLTFYVTDSTSDDVFQFTVPTPLDIANAVDTGNVLDLSSFGDITDVRIKPDDKLIYFSDNTNDRIILFSLPADGNISNAVFLQDVLVGFRESNLRGFFIRENDGEKLWVCGQQSGVISSFDMSLEFNNAIITNFGEEITTDAGETLVYA